MAQTIADLEKERAELLKAIESQAQQLSSNRADDAAGHSLTDWLNAAEEIMPTSPRTASKSATAQTPPSADTAKKPMPNKTSFFGVIILLTLLLTILGVLYIAYTTINRELQEVKTVKEETQANMQRLQQSMDELQQALASGGQPELFIELEQRVSALESRLESRLEAMQSASPIASQTNLPTSQASLPATNLGAAEGAAQNTDKVVTEAILDEKLKAYTTQLEKRIDQKLETILQHLMQGGTPVKVLPKAAPEPAESEAIISAPSEPNAPSEPTVSVMEQPLLKLVEPAAKTPSPAAPEAEAPVAPAPTATTLTADENWLLQQPAQHYVLQLASMADKQALEKMVMQKGMSETRIVMQKRQDDVRYVLLTGSYANRADAGARAKELKERFGISPWVRKAKDLTTKLPQ